LVVLDGVVAVPSPADIVDGPPAIRYSGVEFPLEVFPFSGFALDKRRWRSGPG